jgi:hypothetical protein
MYSKLNIEAIPPMYLAIFILKGYVYNALKFEFDDHSRLLIKIMNSN